MNIQKTIAISLLKIKAVVLNLDQPFVWASGINSPIYCDNRITLSDIPTRNIIAKGFQEVLINQFPNTDAVVGVATAGIPHGMLLADRAQLPFAYVRSAAKKHGRQNTIEGKLPSGQSVVVIEDLISTGGSSLEACQHLIANGNEIHSVLSIFNYGFTEAIENFNKAGIKWHSLCTYPALIEVALETNYITETEYNQLTTWYKNPHAWGRSLKN